MFGKGGILCYNNFMNKIYPEKLKKGDEVRVIVTSSSMSLLSEETKTIANQRLSELGLKVSFGKNVAEMDEFLSSSIESRVEDLHDAFSDKNVKAIFTVLGGYNANQLLNHIDWDIIKDNPKIFCGYSDVTILNCAIYHKTGLVNYYGPHYSTFGQKLYFDYTLDYFKKCILSEEEFFVEPSSNWSDDVWYENQEARNLIKNSGYLVINEGEANGTIVGGNLCTFNLLQGTEYFPDLTNTILFIEDDELSNPVIFDRDLQSMIHQSGFSGVKGLIIGRFQNISNVTNEKLIKIIKTKRELDKIPVIVNVDFGHTDPKITFPIGEETRILAKNNNISEIKILNH
jgi:muramoyltetrapeptide carboxypeptidase LdcA involved in peptidoglycan recycling